MSTKKIRDEGMNGHITRQPIHTCLNIYVNPLTSTDRNIHTYPHIYTYPHIDTYSKMLVHVCAY